MKSKKLYRWDAEQIDQRGHIFLSDLTKAAYLPGTVKLTLRFVIYNGIEELTEYFTAPVNMDTLTLPEYFLNESGAPCGYKVPERFHRELSDRRIL